MTTDFAPYFRGFTSHAALPSMQRLRFDVYCTECGWLPAADHPDGREQDAFDEGAVHFGACNLQGELIGYARLVFPRPVAPGPAARVEAAYPFELHGALLHQGVTLLRGGEAAEVSRLMVRRDYRRRSGDTLAGVGHDEVAGPPADDTRPHRRQGTPQVVLSLYRQMFQHSRRAGIHTWYAAMEAFLPASLARLGFRFEQIGEPCDYFGPVAPYRQDLAALERELPARNPALMAWLLAAEGGAP